MLVVVTIVVVFAATFLAAAVAVVVAWAVIQRSAPEPVAGAPADPLAVLDDSPRLLKTDLLSTISLWQELLARFDFVQGLKTKIGEAGLTWSVGRVTLTMLLAGSLAGAAAWSLEWLPGPLALALGALAAASPYLYVLRKRAARLARFEEQFPDALDFLSRALRAGHPFAAALEMLVQDSPQPLAGEMRKAADERALGMSWDQALDNLATRVPLMDVSFFTAAVLLQSRTGGKLGEVLGRLSETMRERGAIRGEIRSLSTHGRLTGLILTLIPIIVAAVMTFVNPAYVQILLTNPYGKDLVLAAAACLVLAHFVIRRIVNIRL